MPPPAPASTPADCLKHRSAPSPRVNLMKAEIASSLVWYKVRPPGQGAPPGQVQVDKKASKLTQALQRGSATISQLVKLEKKAGERLLAAREELDAAAVAHAAVVHMASKDSLVSPFFAQPSHSPRHTINGCSLYV